MVGRKGEILIGKDKIVIGKVGTGTDIAEGSARLLVPIAGLETVFEEIGKEVKKWENRGSNRFGIKVRPPNWHLGGKGEKVSGVTRSLKPWLRKY